MSRFPKIKAASLLPCLSWAREYNRDMAFKDGLAAVIVTLMLIPQSLAYAMLAGLPPVIGLYASILPLIAYALFGTSRALAVGPVAVVSLMTGAILMPLFPAGSAEYVQAAMLMAMLSGLILIGMSLLRLGFLVNFLSHPVVSGFVTASGILITLGQLRHILGIKAGGDTAFELLTSTLEGLGSTNLPTLLIGLGSIAFLYLARKQGKNTLMAIGLSTGAAANLSRAAPVLALVVTAALVAWLNLAEAGVPVVGQVPTGLPSLQLPTFDLALIYQLLPGAVLISLVGFMESVSVAQTFAARRRQRIHPNQELSALGSANIASAISGGMPVTGGFSRSVVSFEAGAQTPLAGALSALGIGVTVMFFTPLFESLPRAVLAATIIVAVLTLVDLRAITRTWKYSRQDGIALLATLIGVLIVGVETGIMLGLALSLVLFLWRTSKPHMAVVGQLPGSQHFRNEERFHVVQSPHVLTVRVDESLYFPNARYLEDRIAALVESHPGIDSLVLMCPGVNLIDASALESLEAINERLGIAGITLHLSEVKGPVMDQLRNSHLLQQLTGNVYLSQYEAMATLDPETTQRTLAAKAEACAKPVAQQPPAATADRQRVPEPVRGDGNPGPGNNTTHAGSQSGSLREKTANGGTAIMKTAMDLVGAAKAQIQEIDADAAEIQIKSADVIIDVREPDEFSAGHLPGAINIPRGLLEFKLSGDEALSTRDLNILLYCKTSGRAALAALAMKEMGYLHVSSIIGGFDAWQSAGKTVVKPQLPDFN